MTAPDLVLHVGLLDTATTFLEHQLERLRPQLRAAGVAFVGSNGRGTEDLAGRIAEERRATTGTDPLVLVSSGDLTGALGLGAGDCARFRPEAEAGVSTAIDAVGAQRVRLVLYTRRQDRLLELSYLREVHAGRVRTVDEMLPCLDRPVLDYAAIVARLQALPGVVDVRVRPVEILGADAVAFVDDFLASVGLQGRLDLTAVDTTAAPFRVLSARAAAMALGMYPELDNDRERDLVRTFLMDRFGTADDAESRVLDEDRRVGLLATYAEVNRKLFRSLLPDLPEDSYDSDTATAQLRDVLPPSGVAPPAAAARDAAPSPRDRVKETLARLSERNPLLYQAKVRYLRRKADVFLISFPKCGRTWLRVMLAHAAAEHLGVKVGNPLRFTTGRPVHPGLPRVLATHDDSPQNKDVSRVIADKRAYRGTKVVLLVRDPRDVVVSLYFHVTRRHGRNYEGSISDFVRDRTGSLASLLAFYDAWAATAGGDNVLLVRYEDMRADPARELRRVLGFVGLPSVPDTVVQHAVDQASFETLQRAERDGTARTKALRTSSSDDPESFKVRRGKVGGYVDYLSPDDVTLINQAVAASPGARAFGYARPPDRSDDGT